MSEVVIDALGHRCPIPSLRLARAMRTTPAPRYVLLTDDPMARIDVPHLMGQLGGLVLGMDPVDRGWRITVSPGDARPDR